MLTIDKESLAIIKDFVYIITALAGFVLGLLGYLRSKDVDRRVRLEPYFRKVWRSLSKPISNILDKSEKWIDSIDTDLRPGSPEKISNNVEMNLDIGVDEYDWDYDTDILIVLTTYLSSIDKLRRTIKDYNEIRHPTTSKAATLSRLHSIGLIEERADRDIIERIIEYFDVSPETTIKELEDNPKYKQALESKIISIKSQLSGIKDLHSSLKKKKSRYDFIFLEA